MHPVCNYFVRPHQGDYSEVLSLGKLLATNAKLAAKALKNEELEKFDPIVPENSCQIRALFAILHSDQVAEEAAQMEVVWRPRRKKQSSSSSVKSSQRVGSH
jgi:hypothetical protein